MPRKTRQNARRRGAFWRFREWAFPRRSSRSFTSTPRRSRRRRLSPDEAVQILAALRGFPILPVTEDLVFAAIELKRRFQISYRDAAIIAAAVALEAREIFSEDLNDGQTYGTVRVVNPFK